MKVDKQTERILEAHVFDLAYCDNLSQVREMVRKIYKTGYQDGELSDIGHFKETLEQISAMVDGTDSEVKDYVDYELSTLQ